MQNLRQTKHPHHGLWILLLAILTWCSASSAQVASADSQRLLEQGYYWQLNGRDDLAESTWQRILRIDAQQVDALFQLGVRNAQRGDIQAAQDYLARLRAAQPQSPYVARLASAIAVGRIDPARLAEARRLAQAGKTAQAIEIYRELFASASPEGALAVEYYLTLGGSEVGWGPARDYFAALVKDQPQNPHFRLLLARHLTYRESTRREGARRLAELADVASVSDDAVRAWRQALVWLQAGPGDEGYFTAYLSRYSDAPELRTKLRRLEAQRALDRGELDMAAAHFQEILRAVPRDAAALGGLGLVRLKQKRFKEAADLLEQASKVSPETARGWREALQTARFWDLFDQATAAREAKDYASAEVLLRDAMSLAPGELAGSVTLGGVLIEQGRLQEAEQLFAMVLAERPEDTEAGAGLVQVIAAQGRLDEATALAAKLPADDPRVALVKARIAMQRGDVAGALALTDAVLATDPTSSAALDTKAAILDAAGRLGEALAVLEQFPSALRTEGRGRMQRQLWIRYQVQRATQLAEAGLTADARQLVLDAEQALGDSQEHAAQLAEAWARAGDTDRALTLARRALATTANPPPALRLQLGGLLMSKGLYGELEPQLQALAGSDLSPAQQHDYDNLRVGLAVTQADAAREEGDLAGAYDWLVPALAVSPDNPSLKAALGRLHAAAGDLAAAAPLYEEVAAKDPMRLDAWTGAIDTRLRLRDFERAASLRDRALQFHPNNPQLLVLSGRLARAQGDSDEALRYFRLARAHPDNLLLVEAGSDRAPPPSLVYTDEGGGKRSVEADIGTLATPPPEPMTQAVAADAASARARVAALQPEIDALVPHASNQDAAGAPALRMRDGESGLDELTEYSLVLEGGLSLGASAQLWGRIAPMSLDAGYLSSQEVASRFGTNAFDSGAIVAAEGQSAAGTAAHIGLSASSFSVDVGHAGIGFEVENVVGGLRWRPRLSDAATLGVEVSQRELRDSLLSYAGATDTRTGFVWGGVVSSGGGVEFGLDSGDFGLYASAAARTLGGERVADNDMVSAAAGFYAPVGRGENHTYQLGANLVYLSYDQNLRYFSFGHGGYFSPQSYVSLAGTFERSGRNGRLSHRLGASLGIQSFREDAADYFPNDPDMQNALEVQAAADPDVKTRYPGQSVTDLLYTLRGELEYLVADQLSVGGFLSLSQAEDYEELVLVAYVRHWIAPRPTPVSFPPEPFRLHP